MELVTSEDIDLAEKICGNDTLHVKGKTMRCNPTTTTSMTVAMPKEPKECNEDITLHVDVMRVNKIGFVTSTSHSSHCQGCKHMNDNAKESFSNTLDKMPQTHKKGGHQIACIKCNNKFQNVMEEVKDKLGVEMNCANAQDHVAAAEQNDRTIEEPI